MHGLGVKFCYVVPKLVNSLYWCSA